MQHLSVGIYNTQYLFTKNQDKIGNIFNNCCKFLESKKLWSAVKIGAKNLWNLNKILNKATVFTVFLSDNLNG